MVTRIRARLRRPSLLHDLEITEMIERAVAFEEELQRVKAANAQVNWYPYDSIGTFSLLNDLLTAERRFPFALIGGEPVLDIGCGDGVLSFLLERLGCDVCAIDNVQTNYNGMRGVNELRRALGSSVKVQALDLDSEFRLPGRTYGLALFFGVLYHLKNPFLVLENLARKARYCLLSAKLFRYLPGTSMDVRDTPVSYLVGASGLNSDDTNYWVFSETGLRVLLERTGWEVCDWMIVGDPEASQSDVERDQRVFCLLRSRAFPEVRPTQLLQGWHRLEYDAWRWTAKRFSLAIAAGDCRDSLTMEFVAPEFLLSKLGPITITATCNGLPLGKQTISDAGDHLFRHSIPAGLRNKHLVIEFQLDKALAPHASDGRERGIIVRAIDL